jgi:ubiquinol-cytochrome c reductase cytochrome b subunit
VLETTRVRRLLDWLDHRTGIRDLLHEALYERIPGGARWRYVWGSSLVFVFFLQVITGFMLWCAYSPSTRTAWESVYYIQYEMTLGWLIRGIHHFAAQAMIVLLVLHLMQVVIDGAYRAPREVNFWLGLILMQIVLGLGLTGYLLPWDQKGYYATQVATEIMGSTPAIGPEVQKLAQGDAEYGHHTLTRFFAMHAGILPALLVAFLGLHIYVFRRHGITVKNPDRAPEAMFWPDQILKDGVACLAVLAAVLVLSVKVGAELTAPSNPAEPYNAARPEWYYLFLFRFLKFGWVTHMGEVTGLGEAFGAIVIPGILMALLALMPLTAKVPGGHKFNVIFLWVVALGAAGLTGLAIYEDRYEDSPEGRAFRAAVQEARVDGERTVELAQSPTGIPPEGAIELLRNDPLTQGPKIFAQYCADCHQPASFKETFKKPPQAPELADLTDREKITFGSREWFRSVLTGFEQHFAALKNITADNATAERAAAAETILSPDNGAMLGWSTTNGPALKLEANKADFEALVEFLYAQGGHVDAVPPDDPKFQRGRAIFDVGELTNGTIEACSGCHTLHVIGEAEEAFGGGQPILTGYGGKEWLRAFITDPAAQYGDNNAMPAFGDQLTPHQLEMLVRWMTGDYYRASEAGGAPE